MEYTPGSFDPASRSDASLVGNPAARQDFAGPDKGAPAAPLSAIAPTDPEQSSQPDPAPPSKPPFYKRRWFIIISIINTCISIALLFILLFPVVRAIIQGVVNKATLDITTVAITNLTDTSFQLFVLGTVSRTSIFPAVITFQTPINVSWIDDSTKVPLGYMQLSPLHTSHEHATINDTTTFYIVDQSAFGRFTSATITSQNFTWQLESNHLSVQAEKFPTAHGISFDKLVTINGTDLAGNA